MKYETPDLTALTLAINAIQGCKTTYAAPSDAGPGFNDMCLAYEDWE